MWRTLLCGALLALIPVVGVGISAVYVDRRRMPSTYDAGEALRTAILQVFAVALLLLLCWVIFGVVLGVGIELHPRLTRPPATGGR